MRYLDFTVFGAKSKTCSSLILHVSFNMETTHVGIRGFFYPQDFWFMFFEKTFSFSFLVNDYNDD